MTNEWEDSELLNLMDLYAYRLPITEIKVVLGRTIREITKQLICLRFLEPENESIIVETESIHEKIEILYQISDELTKKIEKLGAKLKLKKQKNKIPNDLAIIKVLTINN